MSCTVVIIGLIVVAIIVVLIIVFAAFRRPAHRQVDYFTSTVDLTKPIGFSSAEESYERPIILRGLLSPELCQRIMERSIDHLQLSATVGGRNSTIRNSLQYWLDRDDPEIQQIYNLISEMYQIPIENGEDLQVVRYKPGQYYNEHHDACCDGGTSCSDFLKKGGNRVLTVLIYLNDQFSDGETNFPNLNWKGRVAPGDAILFHTLASNNQCHPHALHAGMPVTSGEKWVCNLWFRERMIRPVTVRSSG